MSKKEAKELLLRYKAGNATEDEESLVKNWMLYGAADNLDLSDEELIKDLAEIRQRLQLDQPVVKTVRLWPRIAAVASVLLVLSIGGYFLLHNKKTISINNIAKNDIAPGKNGATLTLSNGKKIALNEALNGQLANQAGVTVNKTQAGEIVYTAGNADVTKSDLISFNILTTNYGEQYQVILPDNSHVWLNAGSSLKYPTKFTGKDRVVELAGEGYFEVAHNAAMPFKVKTLSQEVEVLGTHFNINAYADEPSVKTTLLEGSVKVSKNGSTVILKPEQQSIIQSINNSIIVNDADIEAAVAWKNGDFHFNNEDFKTVMRKISRWYNVEVVYDPSARVDHIPGGWVSRSKNISAVLKIMELTGKVHFKVEGRRITVTK